MEEKSCVHCGEDCGKHPVIADNLAFCCEGCKMVYFILNEKKLGRYYEIQKMPGIKIEEDHIPRKEKYAYLDLPDIQEKLLDFNSEGISKITLFIPSIHCASCIWLLENLYTLNGGVIQSMVNFPKKEITVTFKNQQITLRQLVELLSGIHYIPEISLKNADKNNTSKANKTLLIKIGIAGFSFMNSMIYHFPQYLPGNRFLDPGFKSFFGWLSFGLALPVLFYCAEDYFKTAFKSLKNKSISIDLPIALGLIAFFLQSIFEIVTGAGIGYIDSLTGLVFFMLVGKWYQGLTYQALSFERDYKTYFPVAVTVIEDEKQVNKPIDQLKAGDVILVRHYEIIPADSIISKGEANIDYSFVTGESIPVRKNSGDFLFAGGRQIGGAIYLQVKKDVQQSYLTQLWNQNNSKNSEMHYLKSTVNQVSQYFTIIILLIALLSAVYWWFNDPSKALFALTSVLIIACPCALALTVPFTFGNTMRQFGRSGFYLKSTEVIENLKKIDTIVFDKTGTITYSKSSNVLFEGDSLSESERQFIKSTVFQSTHPMSKIISEKLENELLTEINYFVEYKGLGIEAKRANEEIRIGSEYFITGKQSETEIQNTQVWIEINKKVKGRFVIENHYREGLKELLENLGRRFDLHLISGDNDSEMKNLKVLFPEHSKLNFNQTPTDKLNYIKGLKENGKKVMMVGDGLNDAGALFACDVGIVIADDIYNFTPACDAILQSSKFQNLNKFIYFTRKSLWVVWISFIISFLYNSFGLFFAVQGNLSPIFAAILMPVSSVSVVAFASFAIILLSKRSKL